MLDLINKASPSNRQIHTVPRKTGLKNYTQFGSVGIIAAALMGSPTESRSEEQILKVTALHPSTTISLLTAPHTGKKICDIASSTSVIFFNRANHGPHKFARVEILEGACAGQRGYVAWASLDPEPRED